MNIMYSNKQKIKKETKNIKNFEYFNNINKKSFGERLMMIKAHNFSLISSIDRLTSFKIYNKIGINILYNVINNIFIKIRISIFMNILSFYYDIKDNTNFINIKKLLSNILLKKLLNKKCLTLKYFFYKFHSKIFSLAFNEKNDLNEFTKIKKINNLQEQKIIEYKNIIKNYESQNSLSLKEKVEEISDKYEEIISKISKENTKELMKLSNENISLRTSLNELSKQNEIQMKLIQELNEKKMYYEEKEKNVDKKINEIKLKYENFQKSVNNMNITLEKIKKENNEYKIKNKELIEKLEQSKKNEYEYNNINKEKEELKIKYNDINNKYTILRSDYVKMKISYDNNQKEFQKAIKEMDTYSQLLMALEKKMNKAENDKKKAELERDKAYIEIRNIRERYINIMSNNNQNNFY